MRAKVKVKIIRYQGTVREEKFFANVEVGTNGLKIVANDYCFKDEAEAHIFDLEKDQELIKDILSLQLMGELYDMRQSLRPEQQDYVVSPAGFEIIPVETIRVMNESDLEGFLTRHPGQQWAIDDLNRLRGITKEQQ